MRHNLIVCAIFRDEAVYLDEWLTFHSHVGVTEFWLYNDRSLDNYQEVLSPWIASGRVRLFEASTWKQVRAYQHCLTRNRFRARWIAYIDLDEFLWSPTRKPLPELLENYAHFSGVAVRWVLFGSSGHTAYTAGVLESFTHCLPITQADPLLAMDEFDAGNSSVLQLTGSSYQGKSVPRENTSFLNEKSHTHLGPEKCQNLQKV